MRLTPKYAASVLCFLPSTGVLSLCLDWPGPLESFRVAIGFRRCRAEATEYMMLRGLVFPFPGRSVKKAARWRGAWSQNPLRPPLGSQPESTTLIVPGSFISV